MPPECEKEALQPKDVPITELGTIPNAFGKFELEAAAAMIVKYYIAHNIPFSVLVNGEVLFEWATKNKGIREWSRNPFWRPDFFGLIEGGWTEGWELGDPSSLGRPSQKFIDVILEKVKKLA